MNFPHEFHAFEPFDLKLIYIYEFHQYMTAS